jgi:YfiH family protein
MAEEAILPAWSDAPTLEADALISGGAKAVLAVQTADCAAVLLADPETRMVAAIHAGWRGTAGGVIRNTVRRMGHLGAGPSRMLAAVGPCICQGCYEVGEEVASRLPESADPIRGRRGRFTLDLANAVEVSLIAAGLTTSNIDLLRLCTACDGRFFSHRGSGGTCGRNLGFIAAG